MRKFVFEAAMHSTTPAKGLQLNGLFSNMTCSKGHVAVRHATVYSCSSKDLQQYGHVEEYTSVLDTRHFRVVAQINLDKYFGLLMIEIPLKIQKLVAQMTI